MTAKAMLTSPLADLLLKGASIRDRMDARAPDVVANGLAAFPFAIEAARANVAVEMDRFVQKDTIDFLRWGWGRHQLLRQAAQRTLNEPGRQERVRLTTHSLAIHLRPAVDVSLDGRKVVTIDFDLEFSATVTGLVAMVERGRLTVLEAGDIELAVELTCEGRQLAATSLRPPIELAGSLPLGAGLPLIDGA